MRKKLPRLWDERMTSAKGRKVRRHSVRRGMPHFYANQVVIWGFSAWDKVTMRFFGKYYRTRAAAENWLKHTTVKSYRLREIERNLDRGAA